MEVTYVLIPGYDKGSDLTIINDFYIKPRKDFDTGNCHKYKRDPPDGGYYG